MKKSFLFSALTLLFISLCFVACDNDNEDLGDAIWDIYPLVIRVEVTDSQGYDLLNPYTENNWREQPITATYKGETYEIKWDPFFDGRPNTRLYPARFYGLYTRYNLPLEKYMLEFGEFDGMGDYENETLTIDWGNGRTDVITYSWDFEWVKDEPKIKKTFWINGVETTNPIKIVLE